MAKYILGGYKGSKLFQIYLFQKFTIIISFFSNSDNSIILLHKQLLCHNKKPSQNKSARVFKLIVSDLVICRVSQTSNAPNSMLS